jgi:hypothetical protein
MMKAVPLRELTRTVFFRVPRSVLRLERVESTAFPFREIPYDLCNLRSSLFSCDSVQQLIDSCEGTQECACIAASQTGQEQANLGHKVGR